MPPISIPLASLLRDVARDEILPRFRHTSASAKADGSLVTEADLAGTAAPAGGLPGTLSRHPAAGRGDVRRTAATAGRRRQQHLLVSRPLGRHQQFRLRISGVLDLAGADARRHRRVGPDPGPGARRVFYRRPWPWRLLNGEPIRPYAPGEALADCLAMVDFKRLPPERIARLFSAESFRSQRNLGSVALDWCWLAAGRFQLYLHGGQKLWDYAAGRLIADEAGVVSSLFAPNGDRR
jgi:myo-inositol-1(or 4)-monophosphatase